MSATRHVLKRVLMVLAGYFVAALAGLLAVVALYVVLGALPRAPDYFGVMSVTPIEALLVPPLGMFIYFLTIVLTGPPALALTLITEAFSLRSAWLHAIIGAACAALGFFLFWPHTAEELNPDRWADMGIVAVSGLVAGFVYWLIAGRDAGFRRPRQVIQHFGKGN